MNCTLKNFGGFAKICNKQFRILLNIKNIENAKEIYTGTREAILSKRKILLSF